MKVGRLFLLFVIIAALSHAARNVQARVWTDATGKYSVEANFVSYRDDFVRLQTSNGDIIAVPLYRLSNVDQYIAMELEKQPPTLVSVEAVGKGDTPEEALNDAFRQAVEKGVGVWVNSNTEVVDDRVTKDRLLTFSDGFVSDHQELETSRDNGLYVRKIKAVVQRRELTTQKPSGASAVASEYSEAFTKLRRRQIGLAIIQQTLDAFSGDILDARIVDRGHSELIPGDDQRVRVTYQAVVGVNRERYESLQRQLTYVLGAVARYSGSANGDSQVFTDDRQQPGERDDVARLLSKHFFSLGRKPGVTPYFEQLELGQKLRVAGTLPVPFDAIGSYRPQAPSTRYLINIPSESAPGASSWRWFEVDARPAMVAAATNVVIRYLDEAKKPIMRQVLTIGPWMPGISPGDSSDRLRVAVLGPFFGFHTGSGYAVRSLAFAHTLRVRAESVWDIKRLAQVKTVDVVMRRVRALESRFPKQDTIDLLGFVDLQRDVQKGKWSLSSDTTLESPANAAGILDIPYRLPEEYSVTIVAERKNKLTKRTMLRVWLVGQEHPFHVTLDDKEGVSGLSGSSGVSHRGTVLPKGERKTIVCVCRRDSVVVEVDGKTLLDWKGDFSTIEPQHHDDKPWMKIQTFNSHFVVSKIELKPLPKSQVVDLLKKIDPSRDTLRGTWELDAGRSLANSATSNCILTIPFTLPDEYRVSAVVTRQEGDGGLTLGLLVGSSPCMVKINSHARQDREPVSSLCLIDGGGRGHNETAYNGQVFQQGKPQTIEYAVRKAGQDNVKVTVFVDGKKIIDWTGSPSRLSLPPNIVKEGVDRNLWLQTVGTRLAVTKLELRSSAASPEAGSAKVEKKDDGGKGASTVAPTVDGKSVLDDSMAFVGVWDCGDVVITLKDDFSAYKSIPQNPLGKWKCVNGEAHVVWNDGKQTILRRDGQGFRKLTWKAGVGLDSPPSNTSPAVKKSGAIGGNTGGQESSAKGQVVDLLKMIDPQRDTVVGTWKFDGASLTSGSKNCALAIPCPVPDEYTVVVVLDRQAGKNAFRLGLVVGSRQSMVTIDGFWKGEWASGVSDIDGKPALSNESKHTGQLLPEGASHTIECTVRKAAEDKAKVIVTVDGKEVIDWTGEYGRLSYPSKLPVLKEGRKPCLWLQSFDNKVLISKLELRPILPEPKLASKQSEAPDHLAKKPHRKPKKEQPQVAADDKPSPQSDVPATNPQKTPSAKQASVPPERKPDSSPESAAKPSTGGGLFAKVSAQREHEKQPPASQPSGTPIDKTTSVSAGKSPDTITVGPSLSSPPTEVPPGIQLEKKDGALHALDKEAAGQAVRFWKLTNIDSDWYLGEKGKPLDLHLTGEYSDVIVQAVFQLSKPCIVVEGTERADLPEEANKLNWENVGREWRGKVELHAEAERRYCRRWKDQTWTGWRAPGGLYETTLDMEKINGVWKIKYGVDNLCIEGGLVVPKRTFAQVVSSDLPDGSSRSGHEGLSTSNSPSSKPSAVTSRADTLGIPLWHRDSHNLSDLQKEAVEQALKVWKLTKSGDSCYIRCEAQGWHLSRNNATKVVFQLRKAHVFVQGESLADLRDQEAKRLNWIGEGREWAGTIMLVAEVFRHRWFGEESGKTGWSDWSEWRSGCWGRGNPPTFSSGRYNPVVEFTPDIRLERIKGEWHVLGCDYKLGFEEVVPSDIPSDLSKQ